MIPEEQHLDLLGIFHYVFGGIMAVLFCFPLIHLGVGIFLIIGGIGEGDPEMLLPGAIFSVVGGLVILIGWTLAVLVIVSGSKLRKRRSYTFCLVVAALLCINFPLGTVLGVLTILTLAKDQVKELFHNPVNRP